MPMPIITPRLILRPPQTGDGKALGEAKAASWPELQTWMEWANDDKQLEIDLNEAVCRRKSAEFILRQDMMLFAFNKASGKLIVSTGLHSPNWEARAFNIGYWVRSDETGQGYATEITNALLRYAFGAMKAHRVYIGHAGGNNASQRVIEKLGFEKEGISREDHLLHGKHVDSHNYARFNLDGLPDLDVKWGLEQ